MPKPDKPTLIHVGHCYVDPHDVAAVVRVKKNLNIVRLKSQPNAEYPLWLDNAQAEVLLQSFNIVERDE